MPLSGVTISKNGCLCRIKALCLCILSLRLSFSDFQTLTTVTLRSQIGWAWLGVDAAQAWAGRQAQAELAQGGIVFLTQHLGSFHPFWMVVSQRLLPQHPLCLEQELLPQALPASDLYPQMRQCERRAGLAS